MLTATEESSKPISSGIVEEWHFSCVCVPSETLVRHKQARPESAKGRGPVGTAAVVFSLGLLLSPLSAKAQVGVVRTGNTLVTATVNPEGSITVSSPTVLSQGAVLTPFTGSTTITFSLRTTKAGGSGSIGLKATEFTSGSPGSIGPKVASGNLTYTCSGTPAVGTVCNGTQTASTTVATPVVSAIGANQKTASTSAQVNWSVPDLFAFDADSYSAAITFTVSAL